MTNLAFPETKFHNVKYVYFSIGNYIITHEEGLKMKPL
jgi:hypothetical protein